MTNDDFILPADLCDVKFPAIRNLCEECEGSGLNPFASQKPCFICTGTGRVDRDMKKSEQRLYLLSLLQPAKPKPIPVMSKSSYDAGQGGAALVLDDDDHKKFLRDLKRTI